MARERPGQGATARRDAEVTTDRVFGGAVVVLQRRRGYRFTADAIWLVAACRDRARGRVVDLGAGCGVIGLALARRPEVTAVTLVEVQPALAALARASVDATRPRCPVAVAELDLRHLGRRQIGGAAQLVAANPPFFEPDDGRAAVRGERERARRALAGGVVDFARSAARLLEERGAFALVYPARSLQRALAACAAARLSVQELRFVHPRPGRPARLALILARRSGASPLEVLPPWYEQTGEGDESEEAGKLRQPGFLGPDLPDAIVGLPGLSGLPSLVKASKKR